MSTFDNSDIQNNNENIPVDNGAETSTAPETPAFSEPAANTAYQTPNNAKESPYANSPYTTGYTAGAGQNRYYNTQNPYQPQPNYQPPRVPREHKLIWKPILAILLVAAMVAGGCFATAGVVNNRWEAQAQADKDAMNKQIADLQAQIDAAAEKANQSAAAAASAAVESGELMTPSQVYAQNVDSVVGISCKIRSTAYGRTTEGTSSGSGFILTENGYVATNNHVIEGATSVTVITYGGTEYEAKVIGRDTTNDVAVLKVEAENLPAVAIGSSEDLNIGDMVVAIGNPLGKLTATQTVGYVSGKNRDVTTDNSIISMIQTDAAINAGNSGGPLFNMKGEVVGITTAKYSGTTGSGASIEGIGFAIPIDDVFTIIEDLQNLGYVTGAYLGVTVRNIDPESAAMFGLPTGAYVDSVVEDGSADKAGIQPKDIIIQLGDYTITNITDLTRNLRHFKAGDTTTVTVIRSGAKIELTITLDEKPQTLQEEAPEQVEAPAEQPAPDDFDDFFEFFRRYFGGIG